MHAATERAWLLTLDGDELLDRVHESLLTLADGRFGTRGTREEDGPGSAPTVLAAGVYRTSDGVEHLLEAPVWFAFDLARGPRRDDRRTLDLRRAVLERETAATPVAVRTTRFCSLARPGVFVLLAEGPADALAGGDPLRAPVGPVDVASGTKGATSWMTISSDLGGGVTAVAHQVEQVAGGRIRLERLVAMVASPTRVPSVSEAEAMLADAGAIGVDGLLAEHTEAWAQRWSRAAVTIGGDEDVQRAVNLSLFHVMASVASDGEAAVGARGLSGPAYAGHVFWDADVYVLPFLAATHPPAARAMLAYRTARLGPARRRAATQGDAGTLFPWESASSGDDVTPSEVRAADGTVQPIRTGDDEIHIVADVAWAADEYARWTDDTTFVDGDLRRLLHETARFWMSRIDEGGDGRGHLRGVIGPDEYHDGVDDDAFTNLMARWNLRAAARLERRLGTDPAASVAWDTAADALVDGYDPDTQVYEQFAGFFELEPLLITQIARPPVAADLLLGRERIRGAQVVKQPDVLMAHHLVPDEVAADSLGPNLDVYLPRTAHGSSLSPAVSASLLARAGRIDEALELFELACRIDLDDLTGTTAGGLHLAAMGGVWQALAFGFAGVRAGRTALHLDPHLPPGWSELTLRVQVQGVAVRLAVTPTALTIDADGVVMVDVAGTGPQPVGPAGARFVPDGPRAWRTAP